MQVAPASMLPTTISDQEKRALDQNINTFNTQLKETQKIVSKSSLEEADFLTLLVTQLKTQDPTKPMDDKEFIGQMAQFTSLKQMSSVAENLTNFTKEFDFTKSVSLVGKDVTWVDQVGNVREGNVESVVIRGGESYLKINHQQVSLKEIVEVKNSVQDNFIAMQPTFSAEPRQIAPIVEEVAMQSVVEELSEDTIELPISEELIESMELELEQAIS